MRSTLAADTHVYHEQPSALDSCRLPRADISHSSCSLGFLAIGHEVAIPGFGGTFLFCSFQVMAKPMASSACRPPAAVCDVGQPPQRAHPR